MLMAVTRRSRTRALVGIIVSGLAMATLGARSAAGQEFKTEHAAVRVVTVASGLDHPWSLAFLPDGRRLVTERPGRIRIVEPDGQLSQPLAGVPHVYAQGQGGLLDVALAPRFAENRLVYFSYSEGGRGGAGTAVARGRLGSGRLEDVQVIFRQQPRTSGAYHFGSRLVFAPDGRLFVTLGDRNQPHGAQDLGIHLGKLLRLEPDGSVPSDNPFVGKVGVRPEIWSSGHRNIQGAVLHPTTGALWIHEHGARGGDEINVPEAGRNYGWPAITYGVDYSGAKIGEGTRKPGMEQPIYYWDPSIAPSGMVFYTGDRFPEWRGSLFIGSLKFPLLVRLTLDGAKVVREEQMLGDLGETIRDVRQGPDGLLYLLTSTRNGRVLRLEPR
jgi:aldose sugar dehydrogenase